MENEIKQRLYEHRKQLLILLAGVSVFFGLVIVGSLLFYTPHQIEKIADEPVGAPQKPKPQEPTYFAEIGKDGTVLRVIVADQSFINSGVVGDPSNWIETKMDGSIRYNYASKGDTYDATEDAFIKRQPDLPATFNNQTKRWDVQLPDFVNKELTR